MTVILTLFGMLVFLVSTFTVGFRRACRRLAGFTITGLVLDVLLFVTLSTVIYFHA